MSEVHPVLRKALALVMLGAVISLLWVGLVQPLLARYVAYDASIERSERLLAKYIQVGASAAGLEQLLKQAKAKQSSAGGFLTGGSVELAGADMQERIKAIVEESGGRLRSTQMLAVEEEETGTRKLGVRVNMAGDIGVLQKVLYDFEAMTPYFFVDKLNLQASRWATRRPRARGRRAAARQRGNPAELQVRFDVYAYMRAEAS